MRISDWSSDVCSSDLRVRSVVSAIPRHSAPAGRTERGTSRGDDYDADPILNPDSVEDRRFRNPWDLSEVRTFSRSKADRKSVGSGKSVSVRVDLGGRRIIKKQKNNIKQ